MIHRDGNNSGGAAHAGAGTFNSNYGIDPFLDGAANVDFSVGLDFDGEFLQFF